MSSTRRLFLRRFTRPGSPPGEMVAPPGGPPSRIHVFSFDSGCVEEFFPERAEECHALLKPGRITWIDVEGIGDGSAVRVLGEAFGLHPLAQADVVNLGQRPKAEDYGSHLFCVVRMASPAADSAIVWEQLCVFLGDTWVITFQERPGGDCLGPVRERIRNAKRVVRKSGADFLACAIIDAIVDGYFPALEHYGERLEQIEDSVVEAPTEATLREIYFIKRELMGFRRATWPLRDMLNQLLRDPHETLGQSVMPYLRDAADHAMQVVDVLETYRELAGSFIDVYLSSVARRTNEIMRILTVVSSIFIPLTFLAGVYGMNFDTRQPGNMPELAWKYGYLVFWGLCASIAGTLMVFFWRLGWLRGRQGR